MKRFWLAFIIIIAILGVSDRDTAVVTHALPANQEPNQPDPLTAEQLLQQMSVNQRVGQLFLVSFTGDEALSNPGLIDLIVNYEVGGVVLSREKDNISGFGDAQNVPLQLSQLTNELQQLALVGTIGMTDTVNLDERIIVAPPSANADLNEGEADIPLIIALNHEGDGYPFTHILHGFTEVPSNMAIGATWQPDNARVVGDMVGKELTAVGINMLMGPVLDVLENPTAVEDNALGVRTFGGDPYWVGLMGQAYTSGVHEGGNGRIAVIAKHFPGYGASDRPLHTDIPTVQKRLEQLINVDLVPFFAVTGNANNEAESVDGLLTTHIRYQGFQGNIQSTTNPFSLDPQAISTLMALPELSNWRSDGGVIVSDALGVRSIERFYDDTEQEFPHRVIAKDAFLAGNDLLYLDEFKLTDAADENELANIKDTIEWFQERYRTDVAFQQQVDTAVLRILNLKLDLYQNDFSPENVMVAPATAVAANNDSQMVEIAQEAISLLSPSPDVLAERLPRPPGPQDRIVIFTDVQTIQQCSDCPAEPLISQTDLEERILALYGPQSSGQVNESLISSFSFQDLDAFLQAGSEPILYNSVPVTPTVAPDIPTPEGTLPPYPTATPPPEFLVQESLSTVDWIIFAMLDDENSEPVRTFLAQQPGLIRDKQVIAFAYNSPNILDTTEISQLTAYYGIYSKVPSFLDASVRALFQELPLNGSPPIDVANVSYSLNDQIRPDPNQIISLGYQSENAPIAQSSEETLAVSVGDTIRLTTGVILDQNGNPVPDNTLVRFIERDRVTGSLNIFAEVPTANGVAEVVYVLEARTEGGEFRIKVEAGGATVSQELDFSVSDSEAQFRVIDPTPAPTNTPRPTNTATPTMTPSPTATLTPSVTPIPPPTEPEEPGLLIQLSEFWMLTAVSTSLLFVILLALIWGDRAKADLDQRVGWLLWGIVGGLLFYIYYALGLPGTAVLTDWGIWAGILTILTGGIIGLAAFRLKHHIDLQ